jgi:RNA 3'-terminal phosphate cyclase
MSSKARRAESWSNHSAILPKISDAPQTRSPGYALSLLAESTTSAIHCSEATSQPGVAPEDIGLLATRALLAEINEGGCVDRKHQTLVLLMMVLGSEDVGRCQMGEPTPRTLVLSFTAQWMLLILIPYTSQNPVSARRSELFRDVIQNCTCGSL